MAGLERAGVAERQEPRAGLAEDLHQPPGLGDVPTTRVRNARRPSSRRRHMPGPPAAPREQLQDQRHRPRQPHPGAGQRRVRPVAGQRQQDDPDAGGADDAAELFGRGQVLNSVQVEGLEHPDPHHRGEDDDGDLPGRHRSTGIAEKVGAHQRDHDAEGVRDRQPHGMWW